MHPPRLSSFSYQGMHRYYLTLCVFPRRPVFTSATIVNPILRQFRQSSKAHDIELTAHCFMHDHVHLLCTALSESSELRPFVADAKQRSGYSFRKEHGASLWQKGYYDHVLRDEEDVLSVVLYIVGNPVRARIASVLGEYPFCGSDRYSMAEIAACLQMWTPPWRR